MRLKLLEGSKLNLSVLSIFIVAFVTYFSHLNGFLYNPRIIMFVILLIGLLLLFRNKGKMEKSVDIDTCLFFMTLFPVIRNNQVVAHGSYDFIILYALSFAYYLLLRSDNWWHELLLVYIKRFSMFMVLCTIIFMAFPAIKESILPIVFPGNQNIYTNAAIGLTHHYSANGNFMAIAVGALFWLGPWKNKTLFWMSVGLSVFCLLMTLKRGPLLWCVVGLLVSYYYYNSNKKTTRVIKLLSLIVGILCFVNILSVFIPQVQLLLERFDMAASQESNVTFLSGRESLFEVAWSLFKENKLLGLGWGGYPYAASSFTGFEGMQAHNIYLQLLAETGLVGFSIFMMRFMYILFCSINNLKSASEADDETKRKLSFVVFAIVYYLAYGFSGLVLTDITLVYLFMFAEAITVYYKKVL